FYAFCVPRIRNEFLFEPQRWSTNYTAVSVENSYTRSCIISGVVNYGGDNTSIRYKGGITWWCKGDAFAVMGSRGCFFDGYKMGSYTWLVLIRRIDAKETGWRLRRLLRTKEDTGI
ncbi:hypothetical protein M8C21_032643, partial [Ambrosia artemisiifolia]